MNNIVATTNDDFLDFCTEWCDENEIGTLSDNLIKEKSICIPKEGITTVEHYVASKYFPVLDGKFFKGDKLTTERLGKYNISQDKKRLLFVYRNGKTYVTRNTQEVVNELEANGYRRMNKDYEVYVALRSSEIIVEPNLKKKWDNIMKDAEW